MTEPTTATAHGPLALIVRPDDTADLEHLPEGDLQASTRINDLIGGHFEAITGRVLPAWIAYVAEDEREFPGGLFPNLQADTMARVLGWSCPPGDYVKGVAVFLGRDGVNETDVPQHVLDLARAAGLLVGSP